MFEISSIRPLPFLALALTLLFGWGDVNARELTTQWNAGVPSSNEKAFILLRKGNEIGFHHIKFTEKGDDLHVDIHIEIKIGIGFITLFNYLHKNSEVWNEGQLIAINSRTDVNGKTDFINLKRDDTGAWQGQSSRLEDPIPAQILTTSYFDPNFIRQSQVLNSQDGRVADLTIKKIGTEPYVLSDRTTTAHRYRARGDLALDVWYSESGEWLQSAFVPDADRLLDSDPLSDGNVIITQYSALSDIPSKSEWRKFDEPHACCEQP